MNRSHTILHSNGTHAANGQPGPRAVGANVGVAREGHRRIVEENLTGTVRAGAKASDCDAAQTCGVLSEAPRQSTTHHGHVMRGARHEGGTCLQSSVWDARLQHRPFKPITNVKFRNTKPLTFVRLPRVDGYAAHEHRRGRRVGNADALRGRVAGRQ
jgi:hypothetical protein